MRKDFFRLGLLLAHNLRSYAEFPLVLATALPAKAQVDALHIAIAAIEKMDFVLTWNFKHIANAQSAVKVRQVCESFGLPCPVLCSSLELLEVM